MLLRPKGNNSPEKTCYCPSSLQKSMCEYNKSDGILVGGDSAGADVSYSSNSSGGTSTSPFSIFSSNAVLSHIFVVAVTKSSST